MLRQILLIYTYVRLLFAILALPATVGLVLFSSLDTVSWAQTQFLLGFATRNEGSAN